MKKMFLTYISMSLLRDTQSILVIINRTKVNNFHAYGFFPYFEIFPKIRFPEVALLDQKEGALMALERLSDYFDENIMRVLSRSVVSDSL